jgi:hypothetical protein
MEPDTIETSSYLSMVRYVNSLFLYNRQHHEAKNLSVGGWANCICNVLSLCDKVKSTHSHHFLLRYAKDAVIRESQF